MLSPYLPDSRTLHVHSRDWSQRSMLASPSPSPRPLCHPGSAAASSILAALPPLSGLASHRLPLCVPLHGPLCYSSWPLHSYLDPCPGSGFSCAILALQGLTSLFIPHHCRLWRGPPGEGPRGAMCRGSSSPLC